MITRQAFRPLATATAKQWVCPSCSIGITSSLQQLPTSNSQQKRSFWKKPPLDHDQFFDRSGVPGLFQAGGYYIGWRQYQDMLLEKLNALIKVDHPLMDRPVKDLALRLARNPATAATFNHASMAHNNHFFYQQFCPTPRKLDQFPDLRQSFIEHFGSIDTFERTFKDTAKGMFGAGFVWLVWARDLEAPGGNRTGAWRIMCTYNAGTPYPEAGFMQQGIDMNTNNQESVTTYKQNLGYWGNYNETGKDKARLPPGGTNVMPVLCISLWEHTYIYDYAVTGKEDYIDKFWNVIDWQVVNNRAPQEVSEAQYRKQ